MSLTNMLSLLALALIFGGNLGQTSEQPKKKSYQLISLSPTKNITTCFQAYNRGACDVGNAV